MDTVANASRVLADAGGREEWTMAGSLVMCSNVGAQPAPAPGDGGSSNGGHPREWTAAQVCAWFTEAAQRAVDEVNRGLELQPPAPGPPFTVAASARQWTQLRMEGPVRLGLKFSKARADALPVVASVMPRGFLAMASKNRQLRPGCRLVRVQGMDFADGPGAYATATAALSAATSALDHAIQQREAWLEQVRQQSEPPRLT